MGGPVHIIRQVPGEHRVGTFLGPACTDNFQVVAGGFEYGGVKWHSVEQCFQANKFECGSSAFTNIVCAAPHAGEGDSAYGQRMWQLGQSRSSPLRAGWERIKVLVMLRVCGSKLRAHAALRSQLLEETGDFELRGGASTWQWSKYNGLIQMYLRQLLRSSGADEALAPEALETVSLADIDACAVDARGRMLQSGGREARAITHAS